MDVKAEFTYHVLDDHSKGGSFATKIAGGVRSVNVQIYLTPFHPLGKSAEFRRFEKALSNLVKKSQLIQDKR